MYLGFPERFFYFQLHAMLPFVKILLVGINSKFIHTNLAIRLLQAYLNEHSRPVRSGLATVQYAEWNGNQNTQSIIRGIWDIGADIVLFSTYIWNRREVFDVSSGIRKIMPEALIGFGGPEVSADPVDILGQCPWADMIFRGEGEQTLLETVEKIHMTGKLAPGRSAAVGLKDIPGLAIRCADELFPAAPREPISDLSTIPFPYIMDRLDYNPAHRITYYESSRGCPFSCAYCLSANDKNVRYYPIERVLKDIDFFIDNHFPLVKFTDRTFNLSPERYLQIWQHIRSRYNGESLFHFEIAGEALDDRTLEFLQTMPEGAIQFEIGIQTTNPETLKAVNRSSNPARLADRITRISKTIHTHVDLIAGLPYEDLRSFEHSFNYAFALKADMLQLGFLKILPGTPMRRLADSSPGYQWAEYPPYEVYASPALSWADLSVIKDVEQVLDCWYNTGLMRHTLEALCEQTETGAFSLFTALAAHIRSWYEDGDLYLPRRDRDHFACMASFLDRREPAGAALTRELLRYDFLMQGKPGAFPAWYERRYSKTAHQAALDALEPEKAPEAGQYRPSRRILYAASEYDVFHFGAGEEKALLFVYHEKGRTRVIPNISKIMR